MTAVYIVGMVIIFILGFYAGVYSTEFPDAGFDEIESLQDMYDQMDSEEQKDFLSECASVLAKSRKKKEK